MPTDYEGNKDRAERLEREDKTVRRPTDSGTTKVTTRKTEKKQEGKKEGK